MPVDFLSDEQANRYGRYTGDPSAAQMARYIYLDDADRAEVLSGAAITIGSATLYSSAPCACGEPSSAILSVCPAWWSDTWRPNSRLPIQHWAHQYLERPATHREHAGEIQRRHAYKDFNDQPEHFRLVRWLYSRAWLSAERPCVLFDLTTARMVERKVLLPGVTILTRLSARIRDRAATRLWRRLVTLPSAEQQGRLEALVVVPEGDWVSLWRGSVALLCASVPPLWSALSNGYKRFARWE
jgi:hypothetical protein